MVSVKLENSLTTEERLQITRLIDHDIGNLMGGAMNRCQLFYRGRHDDPNQRLLKILVHINHIHKTISELANCRTFSLDDNVYDDFLANERDLRYILDTMIEVLKSKGKFDYKISNFQPFLSCQHIIYSALHNIVKNAISANPPGSSEVNLNVDFSTHLPDNLTFCPEGARKYTDFVHFNVLNGGSGFPKDKNLEDYFKREAPSINSHVFGLYFVGLAARVLRTPIKVESQEGKTSFSLYHPIYSKK